MKKRSLWILIMSALLCLSMLLSACTSAESEETITESISETESETESESETQEVAPEDEVVDYKAIIDEWSKYLKSVGYEEEATYSTGTKLFTESSNSDSRVTVNIYGKIAQVDTEKFQKNDPETFDIITHRHLSTTFYNVETGERIITKSQQNWNEVHTGYDNTYSAQVLLDTIIELHSRTWTDMVGNGVYEDYEYVDTYSYYTANGAALRKGLEKSAKVITDVGVAAVEIDGTIYHCRDGEIILTTNSDNAHAVPDFPTEYGDYRYFFTNDQLQILNNKYEMIADYTLPTYLTNNNYRYFVLSNGSVYFYATEKCYDNEGKYDYETEYGKYRVWHVIVDKNGNETVVDAPFVLSDLSKIGGLISKYDVETTGIELKGDYQYAEIRRIENGFLAKNVEFVILDNSLTEIASLPRILKNQISVVEGLGNGKFMLGVDNVLGTEAGYVADANEGTVVRFLNSNTSYTEIKGGIILNGKIYDNSLNEVFDLGDVNDYEVYGDAVYYTMIESIEEIIEEETDSDGNVIVPTESETYEESETYDDDEITYVDVERHYVGYVNASGEFVSKMIGEDATVSYKSNSLVYIVVTEDGVAQIYNRLGNRISLIDNDSIVAINIAEIVEEGIVIKASHKYVYINDDMTEDIIWEYEYYIIK